MNDTDNRLETGTHASGGTGRRFVRLSTHYYVLALSERTNRLYEAFRDTLIDIENTWFPTMSSKSPSQPDLNDEELRTLFQRVDHHFAHYYAQDPLGVVVIGASRDQAMFASSTAFSDVIIGKTDGDHSATSTQDLGRIVWPIVKSAMANAGEKLERDLAEATRTHNVAFGIDAVVKSVDSGVGATLLVEDGYKVVPPKGSSLRDDIDNVVDVIIDKVLALGGNVIFVQDGLLNKFQRVALILRI